MTIMTKTGDDGKSRFLGKIVDKDSELLEVVGTLDELQAVIGMTTSLRGAFKRRSNLNGIATAFGLAMTQVQMDLYEIMGMLAYDGKISNFQLLISNLEEEIYKIEKELVPLNKFLIFKNTKARELNLVRTVCRRAERRLVTLSKKLETRNEKLDKNILIYINRLSDYLFMRSRFYESGNN